MRLGNGDGTFQIAGVYSAGTSVHLIDTEDLDQDGKLDFIALGPEQFHLNLGYGDGSFQTAGPYIAGTGVSGAAIRDYTGDGVPDIAIANNVTTGGTVTFQIGLGGGVFTEWLISAAPKHPWGIAPSDLNGDGEVDLILSEGNNGGPGYLTVMLGVGNATFEKSRSYLIGSGTRGFTSGDFNGDGALDVAVGLNFEETVRVALGNGDGTFKPFVSYPSGGNTIFAIATADVDSDGDLDFVIADSVGDSVQILLGIGDGTFGSGLTFDTGNEPRSVGIGDFDADGKPDLATGNKVAGTISILLGNGNGTFQPAAGFAAGSSLYDLVTEDFDGDGDLDLAVTSDSNVGSVRVLSGNGDGTFSAPTSYAVGNTSRTITAGDVSGDGNVDLIVGNHWGGTVSLLIGNGDGTFKNDCQFSVGDFPYPGSSFVQAPVALADIGWLDVVAALENGVAVVLNDGIWPPMPLEDEPDGIRRSAVKLIRTSPPDVAKSDPAATPKRILPPGRAAAIKRLHLVLDPFAMEFGSRPSEN